jgi:hypothetical protein
LTYACFGPDEEEGDGAEARMLGDGTVDGLVAGTVAENAEEGVEMLTALPLGVVLTGDGVSAAVEPEEDGPVAVLAEEEGDGVEAVPDPVLLEADGEPPDCAGAGAPPAPGSEPVAFDDDGAGVAAVTVFADEGDGTPPLAGEGPVRSIVHALLVPFNDSVRGLAK